MALEDKTSLSLFIKPHAEKHKDYKWDIRNKSEVINIAVSGQKLNRFQLKLQEVVLSYLSRSLESAAEISLPRNGKGKKIRELNYNEMLARILDGFHIDIDGELMKEISELSTFIQELYNEGYKKHGNQTSSGGSHQAVCPISVFHVAQKICNNISSLTLVSNIQ